MKIQIKPSFRWPRFFALLFSLTFSLSSFSLGQPSPSDDTTASASSFESSTNTDITSEKLREAYVLGSRKNFDAALEKLDSILQNDPKNIMAYSLRADIYTQRKLLDLAQKDYEAILHLDKKNAAAKFDLSELEFMRKNYDDARPGFLALRDNPSCGDLASFKVFLCDLLGNHEKVAQSELKAFNKVGKNASYYFSNVAWLAFHKKPQEAQEWMDSANAIYSPAKVHLYSVSLIELGYLTWLPSTE